MLRDKNLVSLSRQHQHALALCVRITRGLQQQGADVAPWQAEVAQAFNQEIRVHFQVEEAVLFPAAAAFASLRPLVDELLCEHSELRSLFAQAGEGLLNRQKVLEFAQKLSEHVRKEERQLFEELQKLLPPEKMAALGVALETGLSQAITACALPPPVQE